MTSKPKTKKKKKKKYYTRAHPINYVEIKTLSSCKKFEIYLHYKITSFYESTDKKTNENHVEFNLN